MASAVPWINRFASLVTPLLATLPKTGATSSTIFVNSGAAGGELSIVSVVVTAGPATPAGETAFTLKVCKPLLRTEVGAVQLPRLSTNVVATKVAPS